MTEHERATQEKQANVDEKHQVKHQKSPPSFDKSLAWDTGSFSLAETPFYPRMDEHTTILSRIPFSAQRHEFIMQLHQTYGSRYVQRLVESLNAQTKLTVSAPDDVYEQEADSVAEVVTRSINTTVQRQTPDEEEVLQTQEEEQVQMTPVLERQEEEEDRPSTVSKDVETRISSARGSGQPLSDMVRKPMEQAFSSDFSDVRVHTNSEANELNQLLSARAFTTGQDIFFREGEYNPGSESGQKLMVHELTHVVQQTGSHQSQQQADTIAKERTRPKVEGEECKEELEKGKLMIQRKDGDKAPSGPAWDPAKRVTPSFVLDKPAAKRSNTASSTTNAGTSSIPTTFTGNAAVDADGKKWRYQLASVTSKGKIQIVYYTNDHYPAPTPEDDTGELSNVKKKNWKKIVKDLKDNREGIAKYWSAYKAEDLHENYHWEKEWQVEAKKAVVKAEDEIAKLELGFDKAAMAGEAETQLKPKATETFDKAIKDARTSWMAMGDRPGDPPYKAQAPALDSLRDRVEEHAKTKGWAKS